MKFVNPKPQAPNPKETSSSKFQMRMAQLLELGIWNLFGNWDLAFGIYP